MNNIETIKLFKEWQVNSTWDAAQEKWYLTSNYVLAVLLNSSHPRKYWSVIKTRLSAEGMQLATYSSQLKMQTSDGNFYKIDIADSGHLFRLIQSIPSPKAEASKLWLAQVASKHLDEMQNHALRIYSDLKQYVRLCFSKNLPNKRPQSIEIHKDLSDVCKNPRFKEGQKFATRANIISKTWAANTTKNTRN